MEGAELIEKAKAFATRAHEGHLRDDVHKTPYIFHLEEVAELVTKGGGAPQQIAAAWLHDTVEDTATTIEDIEKTFGAEVADTVRGLTDLPEFAALPLAERKARQAQRLTEETPTVRLVKLADQTSNVAIVGQGNINWEKADNQRYLEGAKRLAEICKGLSPFLDDLFEERYQTALKNLSNAG